MKKFIVNKPQDLKSFLAENLKVSKNKAKELIDTKNILVNSKRVWIANHNLNVGDIVEVSLLNSKNLKFKFSEKNIVYEDNYIIAVNKPPFYISENKKASIEDLLRKRLGKSLKAIHRLDFETSGVLLFAKNYKIFEKFKKLWKDKKVKKLYLAIAHNKANFKKKVISINIEKKPAKSTVFALKTAQNYSLFKIDIKTGRKHQIRIHLSKVGHPIVGDKTYGYKTVEDPLLKEVKRQMLHARSLEFIHPFLNKHIRIEAPTFEDFEILAKKLNLS
ncbi:MAG TPA: RluA family pseudouridine synthase [Persephonella sp.]|nr:RluA family pseudouridine synthase [Hydrogenothermaceae bacterium]HIQ25105.1 RluA family pseudouridine synthase [Persephonella sp.]